MRHALLITALALTCVGFTQVLDAEKYASPPREIQTFLDAPRHLNSVLGNQSPDLKYFGQLESPGMVKLADMAKPYYNMGGLQVDFKANRARSLSTRGWTAINLISAADWTSTRIEAPRGATVSDATWSPDSSRIAFLAHYDDATHIFVADPRTGKSNRLTKVAVLAVNARMAWSGDSKSIFCVQVPSNRGPAPAPSAVANQPRVQVTDPSKNSLRTYRSLLKNNDDKVRLKYYLTGQLAKISVPSGTVQQIGVPSPFSSFDPAPKGDYIRVTTVLEPYSYIVPVSNFGSKEEVWDLTGKSLTTLSERKLSASGADTGPSIEAKRSLSWRPDGNGFSYIANTPAVPATPAGGEDEQGRRGAAGAGAQAGPPRKDRVVQWVAPFGPSDTKTVYQSDNGISSLAYSDDCKTIYISESVGGNDNQVRIDLASGAKQQIASKKTSDTDANPGTLMMRDGSLGVPVVNEVNGTVFLRGTTATKDAEKDAPRPFLDKVEVANGKTTRIFESATDAFESVNSFLSEDGSRLVVDRQSPTEVNNSRLYEGRVGRSLTFNKDYAPDLTEAHRYRVFVTRPDGFKFLVKVTVPKWHSKGMKLPAMFWFYPGEFTDQASYDRGLKSYNKNLFPNTAPNSMALLTRMGYAFVEPDCPIVGPEGRMNDFYVNDLRNNLAATIDELERQGFIDRTKLAIGGHSYGGFSTANAMVHTPFFKAGIAGAGNYNRTLTPISFQSERRDIFAGRATYLEMSSLLYADRMTGALLMYCGMEDQNVGTDPINSERMFNVLESIGKPAALYMYPYEDHGQVAKETIMDMWARWTAWLEKYVGK
ncbi:MAG: prolyl oligopeptidase family serine peptidase [Fimbriimonadaceae bacterium]